MTSPLLDTVAQRIRLARETEALRLLREGYTPRQVEERTGLGLSRLAELARDFPSNITPTCLEPGCGQPRRTGRVPAGWVKVHPAGGFSVWCCSWPCVIKLARTELARTSAGQS